MFTRCFVSFLAVLLVGALALPAQAARQPRKQAGQLSEEAKADYKAYQMLIRGQELLDQKQEDAGVKLITSIPRMFPKSKIRYQSYLVLGKHYVVTRNYELALKQFRQVEESEDPEEQAESIYQTGICYFYLNNYDKAFMSLRRVTTDYPWSVYANEAYYYIGQCHFKLGRWAKAVEALTMVGTSVPPNAEGSRRAEAGQRLYVKVFDRDLVVLLGANEQPKAELASRLGDKETVALEMLGLTGEYYIAGLPTEPGQPKPGDGILQITGGDEITITYVDENTESGQRLQPAKATVQMVSTASLGFTDGAYREYVQGVFGGSEAFLRVKDMDRDTSDKADTLTVRLASRFKLQKEGEAATAPAAGVDLSETTEEFQTRDTLTVTLTETAPHSGLFVGTTIPTLVSADALVDATDALLNVQKGDEIVLEYEDESHLLGPDTRRISAVAKLLIGEIQDVKIEHRVVDSLDLKARKNLIEGKIFLKLGSIFKEVGLTDKAREKADQGLERVDEVISLSLKSSLDRAIVEEAFSVKWDLLLVEDRLEEAIAVCRTLTQLFPDSTLVDQALLKIGMAKMADPKDYQEAIGIFSAVIRLPKSDLKPEAQYRIAEIYEAHATAQAQGRTPDLSQAMLAYKKCAETYPASPFAGDSLDKIANFYITSRDYRRAIELMERIFQDYPDASFLDTMLLKWVIASFRMGDFATAKQKLDQLLAEYPNSKYAEKAKAFQATIDKKLGVSTPAPAAAPAAPAP
jgi:TolA-binding protein